MSRLIALAAASIALSLQAFGGAAAQQTYPTRTVRLILPYGAASAARRLVDTGQITSVLGPAEFAARVKEQRDKLAALAKTLGLQAAK